MARLKRYVKWKTRGQRTERVVYVINEWNMPKPLPGCGMATRHEIQCGRELLRDPEFKTVVKAALEKGAELVIQKQRGAG